MIPAGPTVEETIVRLEHEGNTLYTWRCTPIELDALVLGRLYSDDLIDNAELVTALEMTPHDGEIVITMKHGLGVVRKRKARETPVFIPDVDEFAELYRGLFARLDERHTSGGMHAAALADERTLMYQAHDVGRHNAADKVLGMALLDGADISRFGMLLTSRISGEIARKAVNGNVKWLASRSIPTTLALRVAHEGGLPIVGRAAGKNSYLYR
jgi:FdhD protein